MPLLENESAFDLLYCITFKQMDHQWLAMRASYMDFNVCILQPESWFCWVIQASESMLFLWYFVLQTVMKATRRQLERELLLEDITRLEDLPSYGLLTR